MKRTVYIAVEIKVREFISNILLTYFFVRNNYRVVLGSKDQILKYIENKKEKGGIFFYKAGVHKSFVKILNKKVDVHATIDQEMSPGLRSDAYRKILPYSFHKETAKDIDLYYCLNKEIFKAAKKTLGKNIKNIQETGWPRFEIFQKKYSLLFDHEVKKIKKKYGNFILFNSDFLHITNYYKQQVNQTPNWGLEKQGKKMRSFINSRHKDARINHAEFLEAIEFFKNISSKINNKIVIRPHPGESIKVWKEKLEGEKNIFIEPPNNDVHPWIIASKGVLHRGCTTSFQSIFIKKPTGFLMTRKSKFKKSYYENNWRFKKIPFEYSTKIKNLSSLKSWLEKPNKIKKKQFDILKNQMGLCHTSPSKLILKTLNKFTVLKEKKPKKIKINDSKIKYYYYLIKHKVFSSLQIFLTKKGFLEKNITKFEMVSKIPGGINVKEIKNYINLLNKIFKINKNQIHTYKINQDLVVIDKR